MTAHRAAPASAPVTARWAVGVLALFAAGATVTFAAFTGWWPLWAGGLVLAAAGMGGVR